jgi:hypothetical protein
MCGKSVVIKMLDNGGHPYSVRRLPARALQRSNCVLVETDYGNPRAYHSRQVLAACRSLSKPGKWEVAVEKHTREKVDPDRYYNCSA